MADPVPPFDPKGSRFDQSTFAGRLSHFRQIVDLKTLLTTPAELQAAQDLLKKFERACPDGKAGFSRLEKYLKAAEIEHQT